MGTFPSILLFQRLEKEITGDQAKDAGSGNFRISDRAGFLRRPASFVSRLMVVDESSVQSSRTIRRHPIPDYLP